MIRNLLFATVFLFFAACNSQDLREKLIPKDKVELSQGIISELRNHNFNAVYSELDPAIKGADAVESLRKISDFFPAEEPISIEVVGSGSFSMNENWQGGFTLQYHFPDRWLLATVNLSEPSGKPLVISGINVQPISDSLQNINRFKFGGKAIKHYLILFFTAATPIFVLYALILAIRTRFPRRKWLWLLFIACGIGVVSLDWTSGAVNFRPVSFLLLGSAFLKDIYGPLIISTSIPLGAILFLLKRKNWKRLQTENG